MILVHNDLSSFNNRYQILVAAKDMEDVVILPMESPLWRDEYKPYIYLFYLAQSKSHDSTSLFYNLGCFLSSLSLCSILYPSRREKIVWCVFDDRQLYRPNERIRVKGIIRKVSDRLDGNGNTSVPSLLSYFSPKDRITLYSYATDARGKPIHTQLINLTKSR